MNVNHKPISELENKWAHYDRPADGARYQHYKGGLYEIVATGFLEETETPCVVYRSLENGAVWVRTAKDFLETVEHNGQTVPRFTGL